MKDLSHLQSLLGYTFKDERLLWQSLTHSSASKQSLQKSVIDHYQRFEFLGDSVLNFTVAESLFRKYPDWDEGELTRGRSLLVSRQSLAQVASALQLGEHLLLGPGEEKSLGRKKESILCDAMEAIVGAVFLDGGLDEARIFVEKHVVQRWPDFHEEKKDHKSALQERTQRDFKATPVYVLKQKGGADHQPRFEVAVMLLGEEWGRGEGGSLKEAAQVAAGEALKRLQTK